LREGDTLVQTDLAKSLRLISEGDDSFYEGSLAEEVMQYSQYHKGVYSYRDFTDYQVVWRPVRSSTYRNYELVVTGPPTSGIHLIQEMNILDNFEMRSFGYHSPESLHIMIEAAKLARVDRRKFAGDPDHTRIPVDELISKEYAVEKADRIKLGTARCFNPKIESTAGGTTHFVVVDKFGNIVSSTQTLGGLFGCGEVIGGTGIVFNDRTWWMALKDSPNIVEPGHRANIGHSPTFVLSAGRPLMALGSPGGDGIIQYVMQTLVNVIDYGFNIQDAIEAPRFKSTDLCYNVSIEERISQSTRKILETWGHNITDLSAWTSAVGGVEGFHINLRTGNIMGGYDPRRNSLSAGY
jgi:gamma-glutamyltranspeptidase/glutathione hydrolase